MSRSELAGFVMGTVFCAAGALWGWLGGSCTNLDPCTGVEELHRKRRLFRNVGVYPGSLNRGPRSMGGGEGAP